MIGSKGSGMFEEIIKAGLICGLAVFLLGACGPKTQFVLLPNPDGSVGKLSVTSPKGTQELNQSYQSTELDSPDEVPGATKILTKEQARAIFGEALAAQPEIPVAFILYFSTGTTRLTKKSLKLVPKIIATIEERKSKDISVTGHTDSVGSERLNRRLSFRRAKQMAGILADKGIDPSILEITYHGEGNPLVPTPDGVAEPRNRRVEVTIR